MVRMQPDESTVLSGDAIGRATERTWHWVRRFSVGLLIIALVACSSTPAQSTSLVEQQVDQMRTEGVEFVNLRSSPIKSKRGERIAENYVFDIPSITLKDEPAGTIRIFKDPEFAESERRMYALLGVPGPTTKLDYVTVEGTRELVLHHQLPKDLAQRYIDAFVKTAPSSPST